MVIKQRWISLYFDASYWLKHSGAILQWKKGFLFSSKFSGSIGGPALINMNERCRKIWEKSCQHRIFEFCVVDMADALVSAVVSTILGNISSLWLEELGITGDLKFELERLQSTLSTIQAVLMDAEEKQWKSEAIKNWLGKLKHAAYEVEDILDDFAANTPRGNPVSSLFSLPKQLLFRSKMARKLKDLRKKLDAMAGERSKFHLREGMELAENREISDGTWRHTSSLVNELEVYGREKELEKVINLLLNKVVDGEGIFVYTICGMGGLGKTTLAQLIYNNDSIKRVFDLRIWVCVYDDFDITRITKAIIESVDGSCRAQELDPLQRHLEEKLIGKRFLLVLDDVWNEDQEKWERLKEPFRYGGKGSSMLVTTRVEKVALMMTTTPIYHLGCLSPDDSWNLFKHCAFRMGKSEDYPYLEALGKEIVKKCGGMPLAIKVLGGLMRFKERESDWLFVKESYMWELEDEGSKILEVLRLSYRQLKPHMRQCFSFCSIFPKNYFMDKEELIQLWMANGFVPSKGRTNLHNMGSDIFSELAQRSFFQELDIEGYGTCRMHDLIHDLAQSIMRNECCVIRPSEPVLDVSKTIRHMSVICDLSKISVSNVDSLLKVSSLHSLIGWNTFHLRIGARQKHLRALEVNCYTTLKISFNNFNHLRYLKLFRFDGILSDSICSLHNLQTLKLIDCFQLQMLPKDMKSLKNLMYLVIRGGDALTCMPVGLGQLSCLHVLSKFIVGKEHGFFIEELKGLALEGELRIEELHNVKCSTDARSAHLIMKPNLRLLDLCWRKSNNSNSQANDEEVLSGLQPHSNLKELIISNYQGQKFSNWMMDLPRLVPNLVKISLHGCDRCECLPPLGKLQFLKHLTISGMHALTCIDYSFYGEDDSFSSFPVLEDIRLSDMPSLKVWKMVNDGSENFPLLCFLAIGSCPKLVNLPMLPSLNRLSIAGVNMSLLQSVKHLNSLTSLSIQSFFELTVLPEGLLQHHKFLEDLMISVKNLKSLPNLPNNPSALKRLVLQGCLELESLTGLEKLSSLESLELAFCNSLVTLPEIGLRSLSSLSSLHINNCRKLCSLSNGLGYLTSLQDLTINGCPELKSLPDSIQHLSALRSLKIYCCEGLTSLPDGIQNLTLLSYLEIMFCSNLMCLPQGMQSLKALARLRIDNCPRLNRRCKKDKGEDWSIIAHIPTIDIVP